MSIDKFYTKEKTAKECISLIPELDTYDLIIEPSAGDGSFSSLLNCIAYDIEPEAESIVKQDYLSVKKFNQKHILVVGNPPFGTRGSLAKAFIKHSQEIGAETIAFILPDTFSKLSNQSFSLFPAEWRLIVEYKLPDSTFIVQDSNKPYHVPCSFYIWTKRKGSIDLRKKSPEKTEDFDFLPRGSEEADFSINGNSGRIKNINEITNPKAEHYIKAKNKSKEELIKIFQSINFNFLSTVNGGNAWIGQQDILHAYNKYIKRS